METKECPRRGLVVKDNWGKWRKAALVTCRLCAKVTPVRTWSNRELTLYCSRTCADKARTKERVTVFCALCSKEISKKQAALLNSKSGLYFCNRKCKYAGQKLTANIPEIWPDHYGDGSSSYRNQVNIDMCGACGCADYWKLMVHHIDGNRENNVIENLEVVCANCHCNRHSKEVDGRRIFCTSYLTSREEVKDLDMGH